MDNTLHPVLRDLLSDYLNEYKHTKDNDKQIILTNIARGPNYPPEWALPDRYNTHYSHIDWQPSRYVPYKRLSHFREHLNRLQFCQFVSIPNVVWMTVCHGLSGQQIDTPSKTTYFDIKKMLKKEGLSKYNEHIHFLMSKYFKQYLDITPSDHRYMCTLFRQLEHQFTEKNKRQKTRKNMISYYLITQLILLLFHYHPKYKLPTIRDEYKRTCHYVELCHLFKKTPNYREAMETYFIRRTSCAECLQQKNLFDEELQSLFHTPSTARDAGRSAGNTRNLLSMR